MPSIGYIADYILTLSASFHSYSLHGHNNLAGTYPRKSLITAECVRNIDAVTVMFLNKQ